MAHDQSWDPGAPDGRLSPGEVHVWLCRLDDAGLGDATDEGVLSSEERERARRLVFERDRQRFVRAHVMLRQLLARYLDADPGQLQFACDTYGKPSLYGCPAPPAFNLSHSGEVAVVAVGRAGALGIDIEAVRTLTDGEDIAARFFAEAEVQALRALPPALRERAFFDCWSRKEAFVKAVGQGLSHPLDSFEVTLGPDEPARLVHVGGRSPETGPWTLSALPAVDGYAGALVVRGEPRTVQYRRWSAPDPCGADAAFHARCLLQ